MQKRLNGALKAYDKIDKNNLLDQEVTELKILEMLEKEVYDILLQKTIKPTKWSDVVDTIEMVTKQKRLLLGRPTERSMTTLDTTAMNEEDLDKHITALRLLTDRRFNEVAKALEEPLIKPTPETPPLPESPPEKSGE